MRLAFDSVRVRPRSVRARCLWLLCALALGACNSGHHSDPQTPPATPPPASPTPPAVTDADRDGSATDVDCNDTDATVSRTALVYEDLDSDGLGTGNGLSRCVGSAAPTGFSFASGDCADNDAAVFTLRLYEATDRDSDGFIVIGQGSVCSGASLRAGYLSAIVGTPTDCDDLDFSKWRMAAVYQDIDSDGVGSGAPDVRCIGNNAAVGFSLLGYDPLDTLTDASSAQVSDLELDVLNLVVDTDGDDDDP